MDWKKKKKENIKKKKRSGILSWGSMNLQMFNSVQQCPNPESHPHNMNLHQVPFSKEVIGSYKQPNEIFSRTKDSNNLMNSIDSMLNTITQFKWLLWINTLCYISLHMKLTPCSPYQLNVQCVYHSILSEYECTWEWVHQFVAKMACVMTFNERWLSTRDESHWIIKNWNGPVKRCHLYGRV